MHLLCDDNGIPVSHGSGGHCHGHAGAEERGEHEHCGACGGEGEKCQDETLNALVHMIRHNMQIAANIDKLAASLDEKGMPDAAGQARRSAAEFQKSNMYLNLSLSLYRQHLLENGISDR